MKTRNKEVIVDLFCGAGGESQGIHWSAEKAGVEVEMYSVNHWERAIETHSQNFPSTYQFSGNRAERVKQIGNAVCPKIAQTLTHNAFGQGR